MVIEKSGSLWGFRLSRGDFTKSCECHLTGIKCQNDPMLATQPGQSPLHLMLWEPGHSLCFLSVLCFDWLKCVVRKHGNLGYQMVLNSVTSALLGNLLLYALKVAPKSIRDTSQSLLPVLFGDSACLPHESP